MDSLNTPEKRQFRGGITFRWLVTTILVIFIILASVDATAVFLLRRYYYNAVTEKLQTLGQPTAVADFFSEYIGVSDEEFALRAREYIDNLSDTKTAEVRVLNKDGVPVITSTGFMSDDTVTEDYTSAVASATGMAFYTGHMSSGEKIMSLTVLLPKTEGKSNGGVRYIISLEPIDEQVGRVAVITTIICMFALALVIASGLFFIRSIVAPVNKLNLVARSIAEGNYKQKVEINNRYDEITELGESINYMTEEIDRTDRMRNDFISTVSHELRTPLTAIRGWADTLIETENGGDELVVTGLKVIQNETDRLYKLVEDLLDFSRMESGRLSLRLTKVDLMAELEEAVIALSDHALRDGKKLEYEIPETPAIANADPDRIKQVFVNIIDNAIKYTGPDGRISIRAKCDGGLFAVVVSDNGCGIAKEDLPHVKEKFYKANITVKGSGIGLAVCDEIMKLHGGTLDISSVYGEGTDVTVSMKLG